MAASPPVLRTCRCGPKLTFQVDGRVTMHQSMPLRRLAEEALAGGTTCLHVDLRHCLYMDSTFIGTLLLLHREAREKGAFALVCPSPQCQRLLKTMALDRLLPIVDDEDLAALEWQEADFREEDQSDLKYNVADSHEALVEVGGPTAEPFRAVAASLKRELEAERSKK